MGGRLGRSLQEDQVERSGELGGLIVLNLALVNQIRLVSDQELVDILAGITINLLQPLLDVVEGLLVGDIVDDDDTMSSTVVGRGDGTVEAEESERKGGEGSFPKRRKGGGVSGDASERMRRESKWTSSMGAVVQHNKTREAESRRTGSALDQQYPKFAT